MSEVKKIATRDSYGDALVELGKEHDNLVVLDADLAEATKTGKFKAAFPERFIDCGIAECNMVGIAAGMSTCGKVPFASTFAMFAAGRAFDQLRNTVGYPQSINLSGKAALNFPVFVAAARSASKTTRLSCSFPNSTKASP